jgi:FecR protein
MTILVNMNIKHICIITGLLLTSLLSSGQTHAATAAGKVAFAMGQTQAVNTSGARRSLKRGDEVFSGDRLQTAKRSRLQVSLADGAYISVQPDSEYQIEDYQYSGKNDGSEKAIYRLFKGGIRAVTGLIGRKNREAYKVHTAVATIGIRGTGHNTRVCAGDCPGKEDGLYHNTWEGITYVVNDVDTANVPAGRGVFVKHIEALIQFLDQPSSITAVVTAARNLAKVEEDEELFETGDQRNERGDQTIVAVGSTVLPKAVNPSGGRFDDGLAFVAVEPDLEPDAEFDPVDITQGHNTSVFFNIDGEPIGALFTDDLGDREFGTIDLNAMLGGDDPAAVDEVSALLLSATFDPAILDEFSANPASVAEFFDADDIFWGRWANGKVLNFEFDGSISELNVDELTGNQSIHFIVGPEPPPLPSLGSATYNFIGGTQSTSVSGATIGQGATAGFISVDFGTSDGFINMDVMHNEIEYFVSGNLNIFASENSFFINGLATTSASGSACNPDCLTEIDGSFFGPGIEFDSELFPKHIGIEYDISETDEFSGVAGFATTADLIQIASSTVLPKGVNPNGGLFDDGFVLIAVSPDLLDPDDPNDPVDVLALGINTSIFFNADGEPIGAILTDTEDNNERAFGTIDLNAVLGGDDPAVVAEVSVFMAAADQTIIDEFLLNPATVAEFTVTGGLSTGRWANGKFLSFEVPGVGNIPALIDELTGNQSIHFVYGQEPPPLPTLDTATYNLINGTDSTSVSGATIGNGATSGVIIVDFGLSDASINMVVNHAGNDYVVSGSLNILANENGIFDQFSNVLASTSAAGSACNPDCLTEIDGAFIGPGIEVDSKIFPTYIGLEYDISETDEITGVAGFETSAGLIQILTPQQQLLATTLTGVSIPGGLPFINQIADAVLTGDPPTSISALLQADFAPSALPDVLTLVTATNFDTFNDGTLFITRWSAGDITDVFNNGTPNTFTLNSDQGVHFALGIPTTSVPLTGEASYDFIVGSQTQTTHISGSDIADGGITGGTIVLNFVSALAFPNFTVFHDIETFTLTASSGLPFETLAGSSTTQRGFFGPGNASSPSICSSTCNVDIAATFAGDFLSSIGNIPAELGVVYKVFTGDPFTGAGGFQVSSVSALTAQQQLLASALTGVSIVDLAPFNIFREADVILTGDPPTLQASLFDNGFPPNDNETLSLGAGSQNFDTFNDGTLFITRWGGNGGAFTQTINGSGSPQSFSGDQSFHLVYGIPTTSVPSTGQGTYNFIAGSQTRSTANNGSTIGNGIQSGSITLDFLSADAQIVNVVVEHPNTLGSPFNYTLNGTIMFDSPLDGSTTTNLGFRGLGGAITAVGGASGCSGGCQADFAGTFAGNASSSIGNVPAEIGAVYFVNETFSNNGPGPFNGAGGFALTSTGP